MCGVTCVCDWRARRHDRSAAVPRYKPGSDSHRERGVGGSGTRNAKLAHYDALWRWFQSTDYTKWNGGDGNQVDFQEGNSPHGALIKTYVNTTAAQNFSDSANGSVIVKENYSADKNLMAITVMQRATGFDPANGDWYYAKYMPNGQITRTAPDMKSMPVAGKFNMCIQCHSEADGDDYLYLND